MKYCTRIFAVFKKLFGDFPAPMKLIKNHIVDEMFPTRCTMADTGMCILRMTSEYIL